MYGKPNLSTFYIFPAYIYELQIIDGWQIIQKQDTVGRLF